MARANVLVLLCVAVGAIGCSRQSASATIVITPGQETDTFALAPAPVRLDLLAVATSGATTPLLSIPWPTSAFDIGDLPLGEVLAFEARGLGSNGDRVFCGRSVLFDSATVDGLEIPVFVGRTGRWSRPSGSLSTGRRDGVAGLVDGHYLVLTGGSSVTGEAGEASSSTTVSGFDLARWKPSTGTPILPRAPATMVVILDRYALLIDPTGATWVDFDASLREEAVAPIGLTFADISGAQVMFGETGDAYVVGATRTARAATSAVLHVGTDLALSGLSLATGRAGAAVAWVPHRGLVVVGGSATAPGVEVLASPQTSFTSLPYPPDGSMGAGADALDATRVLVAGGVDSNQAPQDARWIDVSCSSNCSPVVLAGTANALALAPARLYALSETSALVIGTAIASSPDAGQTKVVRLSVSGQTATAEPIALREPRSGATSIVLPTGMVAVAGGLSPQGTAVRTVEVFAF